MIIIAKTVLIVFQIALFFICLTACQPQMGHFSFLGLLALVFGSMMVFMAWKKVDAYELERGVSE